MAVVNVRQRRGSTERKSKLVPLEMRFGNACNIRVETVRIESTVAQVFEQAAVILVSPGFCGKRYDAAARAAPLRSVCRSQHLEFLNRIDLRNVGYSVKVVHRRVRRSIQQAF